MSAPCFCPRDTLHAYARIAFEKRPLCMPERGADQQEYSAIQPPPATRLHLPLPGVLTAGVSLAVDPLRGLTGEEVDTEGAATGAVLGSGTNTGGRASPSARGNFTPDTAGMGRDGRATPSVHQHQAGATGVQSSWGGVMKRERSARERRRKRGQGDKMHNFRQVGEGGCGGRAGR